MSWVCWWLLLFYVSLKTGDCPWFPFLFFSVGVCWEELFFSFRLEVCMSEKEWNRKSGSTALMAVFTTQKPS